MPKNAIKIVALTAVGVMVAGFVMNAMRGTGPVDQARTGFN